MRLTTANLDFTNGPRVDKKYLALLAERPDALCVQEAKNLTLANLIPETWRSLQYTLNEARRGSAICVRRGLKTENRTLRIGVRPWWNGRRVAMLARFITFTDLTVDNLTVRLVACHLPPARYWFLQPKMMDNLADLIKSSPHPVVIGADWNMRIADAAKRLGLEHHGEGIVGFLTAPRLTVNTMRVDRRGLELGYTDHPSVTIVLDSTSVPRTLGS